MKNRIKFSQKSLIRLLIFLASLFLIVYFFPRERKFAYRFDEGKPWKYELLTAPFDIPIYKSAEQLEQEQDSVLAEFQPYYSIREAMTDSALTLFVDRFNPQLHAQIPPTLYRQLSAELSEEYNRGVLSVEEYDRLVRSGTKHIKVLHDNKSHLVSVDALLTTRGVYERVVQGVTNRLDRSLVVSGGLNSVLLPNMVFDSLTTAKIKRELLQRIPTSVGLVQTGERIVDKGEIITPHTYLVLNSLEQIVSKREKVGAVRTETMLAGQVIVVVFLLFLLYTFLALFRPNIYNDIRTLLFLSLLLVGVVLIAFVTTRINSHYIYIVPFAIVPIIVTTFLDSRVALYIHMVIVLLTSFVAPFNFEFILLQLVAGMVAIDTMRELTVRSQLVRCAILTLLAYLTAYVGYVLLAESSWAGINLYTMVFLAISCVLLLFAYLLIYLLEKGFGFTSNVTLIELSDINSPLLRQLSEECPGTFQHSLQVSNLAAEAANRIGASAQLVRTGALYHDIGKLASPAFFTENQSGVNPHNSLEFEDSAAIIIQHVRDGVKRADHALLPPAIKEFITTHHGTSKTKYFFNSYVNKYPEREVRVENFTYPGPIPSSKETAILMMADSVEAASRSLKEYTEESITGLVNHIIDAQIADGQLKCAPISFYDVEQVKLVFIEKLKTIYHTRISYPELIKHE